MGGWSANRGLQLIFSHSGNYESLAGEYSADAPSVVCDAILVCLMQGR